tara:strand:+ start:842 stop:988 length:147 start_codon:yes stop_codon:yes gene_type:complete
MHSHYFFAAKHIDVQSNNEIFYYYCGATEDQKAFDDWSSVYKVKRIIP